MCRLALADLSGEFLDLRQQTVGVEKVGVFSATPGGLCA
jgi:hypothetical protein